MWTEWYENGQRQSERHHNDEGWAEGLHTEWYENGQGVLQDYKEAEKWYRLSADQGFADAQTNLGVKYDKGQGVLTRPPKSSPNVKLIKTIW